MLPTEPALAAADGWDTEEEAEMARDADAARMSVALAVNHHHVGPPFELRECLEQDRRLAERQEPRHIGERVLADGLGDLDHLTVRAPPEHDLGIDPRRE